MRISVLLAIIVLVNSCDKQHEGEMVLTIVSGISHGFCTGYCDRQVTFMPDAIEYREKPTRQSALPEIACLVSIDKYDWQEIKNMVDGAFFTLDSIYGCPDCADQGKEYFNVTTNLRSYRIETDPFLKSIIHPLITELRSRRTAIIESEPCK